MSGIDLYAEKSPGRAERTYGYLIIAMPDSSKKTALETNEPKEQVRPALIVDRTSLRRYFASLSHFLVGLATESYPVAVVAPYDIEAEAIVRPAVEVIEYPLIRMPLFIRQNRRVLLDRLDKFGPTILHCFGSGKSNLVRYVANELSIPYVVTFNRNGGKFFKPLIYPGHCTTLIASSRSIADYLKGAYPRYGLRIRHINLGTFIDDDCACFAEAHGVASIVIAQELDNVSDFEPLLNAVRHLILDGYEFVVGIIGTGHAEGKIHDLIRYLGLSQIVSVVPDMQPIRSVFAGADIFLQPRSMRDFNARLLEAMSVGMAVATSDDCLDDMLIADRTALFFDSTDELSVYDCLKTLLTKRSYARKIAKAGQDYLRRNHSVSRMTNALIQTYISAQKKYKESTVASED